MVPDRFKSNKNQHCPVKMVRKNFYDFKKPHIKVGIRQVYAVNLRNHALTHLTVADTSGNRKREHDIHALKRLDRQTLRQSAPKGRKVLYVWDKAGIDFIQWFKWKHGAGIYFISRQKENMDLLMMGELPFDKKDPINAGVLGYDYVGGQPVWQCTEYDINVRYLAIDIIL